MISEPPEIEQPTTNPEELSLLEFTEFLTEIRDQPHWRTQADKEMDYKDGNQLKSELLSQMEELGIPPAVMPLIGLQIETVLGEETKQRTDWRVIPDVDNEGQEVADALNWKLNQAERRSRADRACSDAYETQYGIGVGWVQVSRRDDPFQYPYRCQVVHRNEMKWDWKGYLKSPMGEEARYLIRHQWVHKNIVALKFKDQAELINHVASGWGQFDGQIDGGLSTNLFHAQDVERGWTIEEQDWRNPHSKMIMLYEVWYRRWSEAVVLRWDNGLVEELDWDNLDQLAAVIAGTAKAERATVSRVRRAWFAGPHKLADEESPYLHRHFGYVPFWGHREDRTGVPFGRIRAMMYMQDNINATLSKIRWGLSSTQTIRTDGAYKGTSNQLRREVARVDADIVLNQEHMAKPGAQFKVDRNFQLNEQQYKMYSDAVAAISRLGGVSDVFTGQRSGNSAAQDAGSVEQTTVMLANIKDNFGESRAMVGDLLLSMIIQDSRGKQQTVNIKGGGIRPDRSIVLNEPVQGDTKLNNDVSRTMLKVTLEDVPSTNSYRAQQLAAFSEAFKSTTPNYQRVMMPHMINLMDVPNKEDIIQAMKEADAQPTPEMIQAEAQVKLIEAQVSKLFADKIKVMIEAQFAAMQAGDVVARQPDVAPIADVVAMNAGFVPDQSGIDPNFPQPTGVMPTPGAPDVHTNTSPTNPPVPASPMHGIETPRTTDNLQP